MCMISARDARVSNTGLLVVPLGNGRQLTVYGNRVSAGSHGAMILPVPSGPIELVDLTKYADMFEKLNETRYLTRGARSKGMSRGMLEVVDVGSYRASIVEQFADFQRLDRDEFRLTPEILEFIQRHYANGFSFIVCKLQETREGKTYHPFGYRHQVMPDGRMFIPTMHYHLDSNDHQHVDWDHSIYLWNCRIPVNPYFDGQEYDERHEYIRFLTTELGLPPCHSLIQVKIDDYHDNHDVHAVSVPVPMPDPHKKRKWAEGKVALRAVEPGMTLPEYVTSGNVVCDVCHRRNRDEFPLYYGWHKDPSTDYCRSCFETIKDKHGFIKFETVE